MTEFLTVAMAREQVRGLEQAVMTNGRPDLAAQLGGCYLALGRAADAARIYELAWDRLRTPEVALNCTMVLREMGRHEEAARFSEMAYYLAPENPYVRLCHGEALLRAGHWSAGWPLYDTGRPTKLGERLRMGLPGRCREWDGRQLAYDDFLLVLMEGGAGDRLNYARFCFAPEFARRVPNWRLFSYEPHAEALIRRFGCGRVVLEGDTIPEMHDAEWCPWWTTAFALPANLATGPADVPQWAGCELLASDQARDKYRFARPGDGLPLIGFCWEAAELSPVADPEARKIRSLTEGQAMRLVVQTGDKVHWVSLQHGRNLAWPMQRAAFETWEDTAGVIANLDAVLTVDTGTLHLAGAMGKPLGILLSSNSDWKFMGKGRCPFYRKAVLYRNGPGGGMESAVSQAVMAIRQRGLDAFG